MRSITPAVHQNAKLVLLAANQPEYNMLAVSIDPEGLAMTEWELTEQELTQLVRGGRIRLWTHTFGHPFQPISLEVIGDDHV